MLPPLSSQMPADFPVAPAPAQRAAPTSIPGVPGWQPVSGLNSNQYGGAPINPFAGGFPTPPRMANAPPSAIGPSTFRTDPLLAPLPLNQQPIHSISQANGPALDKIAGFPVAPVSAVRPGQGAAPPIVQGAGPAINKIGASLPAMPATPAPITQNAGPALDKIAASLPATPAAPPPITQSVGPAFPQIEASLPAMPAAPAPITQSSGPALDKIAAFDAPTYPIAPSIVAPPPQTGTSTPLRPGFTLSDEREKTSITPLQSFNANLSNPLRQYVVNDAPGPNAGAMFASSYDQAQKAAEAKRKAAEAVESDERRKKDIRAVSTSGAPAEYANAWNGVSLEDAMNPPQKPQMFSLTGPAVDLRRAPGYSYEYKNPNEPGAAPGRHIGPMAQDLEQTAAAGAVQTGANGMKSVDTNRLSLVNTAAISEQQRRIDELERALAATRPQPRQPEAMPEPLGPHVYADVPYAALDEGYATQAADTRSRY